MLFTPPYKQITTNELTHYSNRKNNVKSGDCQINALAH